MNNANPTAEALTIYFLIPKEIYLVTRVFAPNIQTSLWWRLWGLNINHYLILYLVYSYQEHQSNCISPKSVLYEHFLFVKGKCFKLFKNLTVKYWTNTKIHAHQSLSFLGLFQLQWCPTGSCPCLFFQPVL